MLNRYPVLIHIRWPLNRYQVLIHIRWPGARCGGGHSDDVVRPFVAVVIIDANNKKKKTASIEMRLKIFNYLFFFLEGLFASSLALRMTSG